MTGVRFAGLWEFKKLPVSAAKRFVDMCDDYHAAKEAAYKKR